MPELVLAVLDQEIQELLKASAGINLAMDFLPGSLAFTRRPDCAGFGGGSTW